MTRMLASVKNLEEAKRILNANVDIIDLKQPEFGALGALPVELVAEIVTKIDKKCLISATVGDLPMDADVIFNAVFTMAKTDVNFVKIGFFPEGDWYSIIQKLSNLTNEYQLIAVLFADTNPDFSVLAALKKAHFSGVMLDTLNKKNGSLTDVMAQETISNFVKLAKKEQLVCGLAGSLRLENIAQLLPHNSDYLGFRGALCTQNKREDNLDLAQAQIIRQYIHP